MAEVRCVEWRGDVLLWMMLSWCMLSCDVGLMGLDEYVHPVDASNATDSPNGIHSLVIEFPCVCGCVDEMSEMQMPN